MACELHQDFPVFGQTYCKSLQSDTIIFCSISILCRRIFLVFRCDLDAGFQALAVAHTKDLLEQALNLCNYHDKIFLA